LEIGGIHLEGTTIANATPNYFTSAFKKSHHGPAHPVRNLIMVNRNFKYKKKAPKYKLKF
jgi:hypothetical protein